VGTTLLVLLTPMSLHAQRSRGSASDGGGDAQPAFSDFKGVRIGMAAEEARKKLALRATRAPNRTFMFTTTPRRCR